MGAVQYAVRVLRSHQRDHRRNIKKKAFLLTSLGVVALSYVKILNLPKALTDKSITYDSLIDQLRSHFGKNGPVLAARHEFIAIRQKEAQSVEKFAAALRLEAVNCQFGGYMDVRLREQFASGLRSDFIRKRLMKNEISFYDALKRATDLESIALESNVVAIEEKSVLQVSWSSGKAVET